MGREGKADLFVAVPAYRDKEGLALYGLNLFTADAEGGHMDLHFGRDAAAVGGGAGDDAVAAGDRGDNPAVCDSGNARV